MSVFYYLATIFPVYEKIEGFSMALGTYTTIQTSGNFTLSSLNVLFISGIPVIILLSILSLVAISLLIILNKKNNEIKLLKQENDKLKVLDASKNKFFSIVAHDLKSPFNSLMGLSEMLMLHAESMNGEQINNYSKMVHQSTSRIYSLVDNLLQWSRTQLGTIEYAPEKIDLNILTGNIVNLLKLSAQEKDIVIADKIEPGLIALADPNIYSAILRNLLNNAIKFSRVGSTIHLSGYTKKEGIIEIQVKDRGVGMSSAQLEKIFRIDTGQSTMGTLNERGTGLGLIICKEFVEINNGSIDIVSNPGEGTSVKFTLPAVNSKSTQ